MKNILELPVGTVFRDLTSNVLFFVYNSVDGVKQIKSSNSSCLVFAENYENFIIEFMPVTA